MTAYSNPKIWYVGPTNPPTYPDFDSIQKAINNASVMPGDIIEVMNNNTSPYYEHLYVNKSLTIRKYAGHHPIIDGKGTGTLVSINASNVVLTGFTIRNAESGIRVSSCNNCISANTIWSMSDYGIFVCGLGNHSIIGNVVQTADGARGISIESPDNTLKDNSVFGTHCYNFGVDPRYPYQKIDTSNRINGKPIYYLVNQSDFQIPSDAGYVAIVNSRNITVKNLNLSYNIQGILTFNSVNITIEANTILNNERGIELYSSQYNIIENNTVKNNSIIGLLLEKFAYDNTIVYNNIEENTCGIGFEESNGSKIYRNNFINNRWQVYWVHTTNFFDNGREGNYWSDYYGNDLNKDGVGDAPHPPDYLPLMEPWSVEKVFNVTRYGKQYPITTFSNSTRARDSVSWNRNQRKISFNLTSGTTENINIIVPRDWLEDPFEIKLGGLPINPANLSISQDTDNTYISFNYAPGSYMIEIVGSKVLGYKHGDINNDGKVNILDCIVLSNNFGSSDE
jgi:parallel beta-helix repeat protein